jgi:hypothetical protein
VSGFSPTFRVFYIVLGIGVFSLFAFLTRARWRRIAGALAAVAVFTAISAPIDNFGNQTGLWLYPGYPDPPHHPPLDIYIGQALIFVGIAALLGYRVARAWGLRGIITFIAVFCTLGLIRDFSAAAMFPKVIQFGPSPSAQIADVLAWLIIVLVGLGVTRIVAGAASRDELRR